ncbi:MAG: dTDP-4-amino-4,6-dideoxygalactose transaminase [bacterium]|nr:dTDP-4-amino-4,6-dideoxygalactose transaminase [bacterium]
MKNKTDIIPFSKPVILGNEQKYLNEVVKSGKWSGDHLFTHKCNTWLEKKTGGKKALLTTSCTHALEMAALLIDIKEGDEVIMPSYTFTSTANAFILRGARLVFIDIKPDTMNMDEKLIESAITERTKAIVPVHYAGVACEMDEVMEIANKYNLIVVEDAAQALMSSYRGRPLGTIGHFGTFSFHETKNYTCGEGGAILINDENYNLRAEIIREKGTNRSQFFRGEIDKYSWQDIGSSYLPSELNAAFLYAQLEVAEDINKDRLKTWDVYYNKLKPLEAEGLIELPRNPNYCEHNAHIFYLKVKDVDMRTSLIAHLKDKGIYAHFHYVPLHSSKAGLRYGRFNGEDIYTTRESERLVRLPLYYGMSDMDVEKVCCCIEYYYRG